MKFSDLSQYLEKLENTSSRLEITQILADLFQASSVAEIDKIVYLLLGRLGPKYDSVVFNLAERLMIQALAQAYRVDASKVRSLYKQKGDLGNVAESLAQGAGKALTISAVFDSLQKIATDEGKGSQERKISSTARLLSALDPLSARFVTRIPVGKLRLGFSDKTILDALSWLEKGDKSAKADLEKAYQTIPDVGLLSKRVKQFGTQKASSNIKPIVGIPILPMLAQRLKSPSEMIEKMLKVAIEPKFDGLRIQIHYQKAKPPMAFTRNLNETSWMFPELKNLPKQIKARSAIFDCEAVGLSEDTLKMVNFQTTMTRRRKHDITAHSQKTPISFQVFDLLYKDGKSFLDKPYTLRRQELKKTILPNPILKIDESVITEKPEKIKALHQKMLKKGLEGVMVKKAASHYIPGRTGWHWVKMKEVEEANGKLADTVDCVVMGYTQGRGKRAKFGIGQFLAGIRDKEKTKTITKVGTGLTDEQFKELNQQLTKLRVDQKPSLYQVHKNLEPDFWVKPNLIVELAADEITVSPTHTSGYALRFPRLVRFRPDKSPAQSTTLSEIKHLFKLQK